MFISLHQISGSKVVVSFIYNKKKRHIPKFEYDEEAKFCVTAESLKSSYYRSAIRNNSF